MHFLSEYRQKIRVMVISLSKAILGFILALQVAFRIFFTILISKVTVIGSPPRAVCTLDPQIPFPGSSRDDFFQLHHLPCEKAMDQ
jgi:hypothetical protein